MVQPHRHSAAAGRYRARRFVLCAAAIVMAAGLAVADSTTRVDVSEANGVYRVAASFAVSQSAEDVMAVLTNFERIPLYVPDMEISRVVERSADGMIVEQQAVSKFMMFSRRVHLMLDVRTEGGAIKFRDRCKKSFASYEGAWLVSQHDSLTVIDYELSAKPAFEVPGFVLKRLLKRDAGLLVDRIKVEIAARANRRQ